MTELTLLNTAIDSLPGSITTIDAVQVYYAYRGRNTWNWTWTTHYFAGAMNATLGQAQQHAESMRKQGSVFYVETLPALLLNTDRGAFVVTQINKTAPLVDYLLRPVITNASTGEKQKLPVLLRRGEKAQRFASSLIYRSEYWRVRQPHSDSILLFRVQAGPEGGRFERFSDSLKSTLRSSSSGPNYCLEWDGLPIEMKHDAHAVHKLAATARRLKPLGAINV